MDRILWVCPQLFSHVSSIYSPLLLTLHPRFSLRNWKSLRNQLIRRQSLTHHHHHHIWLEVYFSRQCWSLFRVCWGPAKKKKQPKKFWQKTNKMKSWFIIRAVEYIYAVIREKYLLRKSWFVDNSPNGKNCLKHLWFVSLSSIRLLFTLLFCFCLYVFLLLKYLLVIQIDERGPLLHTAAIKHLTIVFSV